MKLLLTNLFCLILLLCSNGFTQDEVVDRFNNQDIQLNFRGADLDIVLDYLSEVAGLIIVKETDVSGTLDVWSHQPITTDEAIELLNTVLHEKGYAAIRKGRMLSIVNRDDAKQKDIPVRTGNRAETIPRSDEIITQIIPVRYTDAQALIDNLQPLLPSYATMSSNADSNAVIITDTQSNIRRMVEIIQALDTSISSISSVQVFTIIHSNATDLADIINDLFEEETNGSNNNRQGMPQFGRFGGRGGDESDRVQDSGARRAVSRVVAVADEYSNSLIVSAPDEAMPMIALLVRQVDVPVDDITEIQVFKLEFADAFEMQEQISELFPDTSTEETQFAPRFGRGGPFGGPQAQQQSQDNTSQRQLQQTRVRCVADPRTNSVIVFAAQETMQQIAMMIEQLDSDSSKKQKVFVYSLEYADVDSVAEVLRNIFEMNNTNINRNTNANQNQNTLNNRTVNTDNFLQQSNLGNF